VLSFQPILLEKYMAAADKVLEAALAIPSAPKVSRQTYRPQNINTIPRTAKSRDPVRIVFTSEGSAYLERFHFPAEGEYVIRFRGWGSQVGNEFPKVAVRVDGRDIGQYTVDAPQGKAKVYETRTRLPAGEKRVAIAFTNAFTDPSTNQSRSFGLELLEIEGPFQPKLPPEPPSVKLLLVARPAGDSPEQARIAAEKVLAHFARRAFRRPVRPEEVQRLMQLYDLAVQQGEKFPQALKLPMKAVLVSPHFLFRIEEDPKHPDEVRQLNDFELATRLSYFLWSSMPDEELFQLAEQGKLRHSEVLEAQVRRMLKDPKAKALSENFAGQWLQLRNLQTLQPDKGLFPA
jgi:hypothetical protein